MVVLWKARDTLRHATREIHERLHGHAAFQRLLGGTISRAEYCALLGRMYGFHRSLEAALEGHADRYPMLQLDGRRRAHLLATDLAFLGWSDREVDALPLCVIPRPLDTSGRIAGSLYVKEGALLGGRVLARKLDILLEPGLNGRRFFAGSEHDSELWRNFCSAIEAPVFADHIGDMVTAACETFELFEQWISGQM